MTTPPRFDERAISAGTTMRFVLLVALLVVTSGSLVTQVFHIRAIAPSEHGVGCLLAAGADPFDSTDAATIVTGLNQSGAYDACVARFEPTPPWWIAPVWTALLVVAAVAVFLAVPRWKARRSRSVPLHLMDFDGRIGRELAQLAVAGGVGRVPRAVVDPTVTSATAVVFGRNHRPVIRLHGGLLACRDTDPARYRAVLLHELAHVRNGDITLTYATIALWRVFLLLVLLPYAAWFLYDLPAKMRAVDWELQAPSLTRAIVLTVAMAALVYLARSDVLRSREIHADLTALRWGANPHGWTTDEPAPADGAFRRAVRSFVGLWRTHPQWELRRRSLTDPAALFELRALPMFLTGAAAALFGDQVREYQDSYELNDSWTVQATELIPAGLVTAVAALALWRAVVHAVATGRRPPSGVQAGLWLGAGMAAAETVAGGLTVTRWLPERPYMLLLVVLVGAVFGCWTAQCALLWCRTWRGRTVTPVMLVCLAAGCLALSWWFVWWRSTGSTYAFGMALNPGDAYGMFPPEDTRRSTAAALLVRSQSLVDVPLALYALVALWAVPLAAWTVRPRTGTPGWLSAAVPAKPLPPLRRIVLAAAIGGLTSWAALAGASAWIHAHQSDYAQRPIVFAYTYLVGWTAALVLGMAVAAGIASALSSRYRLLVALVAAQLAILPAGAATFVTESFGGCIPGVKTLHPSCVWLPSPTWEFLSVILAPALALGAVAAPVAAAVVWAVRRLRRPAAPATAAPTSAPTTAAPRRNTLPARRIAAALVFAGAVTLSTVLWNAPTGGSPADRPPSVDQATASPRTRAFQVTSWWAHGGDELTNRFMTLAKEFSSLLKNGDGEISNSALQPYCVRIAALATDTTAYFRIPDGQAQAEWQQYTDRLTTSGHSCDDAVRQNDGDLLLSSYQDFARAAAHIAGATRRIDAVGTAGGLGPPAPK